jgi:hypothetical protein
VISGHGLGASVHCYRKNALEQGKQTLSQKAVHGLFHKIGVICVISDNSVAKIGKTGKILSFEKPCRGYF